MTIPDHTPAATTTTTHDNPHPGYWRDANGRLVPEAKVKDIDKLRTQVVAKLCNVARTQRAALQEVKRAAFDDVAALVAISLEQYGIKTGGDKGNVTLVSFDGLFKVQRHMHEHIVFGEQLMAAKALIDLCVKSWAAGASDNIMALVNHAFQTDKEGRINTGRVLSLRRLDIADPQWRAAMDAIADSMTTASTTAYIRFYERSSPDAPWRAITLDLAAL